LTQRRLGKSSRAALWIWLQCTREKDPTASGRAHRRVDIKAICARRNGRKSVNASWSDKGGNAPVAVRRRQSFAGQRPSVAGRTLPAVSSRHSLPRRRQEKLEGHRCSTRLGAYSPRHAALSRARRLLARRCASTPHTASAARCSGTADELHRVMKCACDAQPQPDSGSYRTTATRSELVAPE
jgi:hypothetical protein